MRRALPVVLLAVAVLLIVIGLTSLGKSSGGVDVASGSTLPEFNTSASTPEQAIANFLYDVQKRNWDRAFANVERTDESANEQAFIRSWSGADGGLRSFSYLENYDARPLRANDSDAQMRARLHWSTPVGPIFEDRDFNLVHRGDRWKVVWNETPVPNVPSQVIPVNYLRWDLVSGNAGDQWGAGNVDAPRVRIVSMNAMNTAEGAVVMGEAVNEDTIPAFVNVQATLMDSSGNAIDDESSFDKILHVLLPKQVTPYRIDFPHIDLSKVKNVHIDVKATLVPASSDPVIGVMNQKLDTDAQGHPVLHGDLLNQSGETVNIPHVIVSFYDSNGKVVWVSDGYVQRALPPKESEAFAVEIPKTLAGKVQNFHVVVNQFSLHES